MCGIFARKETGRPRKFSRLKAKEFAAVCFIYCACRFLSFRVAMFAVEFKTYARSAAFFGQNPFARDQRRTMPDVLKMPAVEFRAPIARVVFVETYDLSFHNKFKANSDFA
jgi:hypothetical protein